MLPRETLRGTTAIGLVSRAGVVFAADRRASYGTFIASKRARKIFNINDQVGIAVAGVLGDAEALLRVMRAEAALYEHNTKERMSPKAVAYTLAIILQGSRIFPYLTQILVGGLSAEKKAELYALDPVGGVTGETVAAAGSGSPIAYGILEREYSAELCVDDSIRLALKALKAAMERDSATGDGINLAVITEKGFREFKAEEIDELLRGL